MLGSGKSSILPTAVGASSAPIHPDIPMAGGTAQSNLGFLSALRPQNGGVTTPDGKEISMADRLEAAMKQMSEQNQPAPLPNVRPMGGPAGEGQQLAQTLANLMQRRGFR